MMNQQPDTLDLNAIRADGGYLYLATPYSKYPGGIDAAFTEACRAAAWFVRQGIGVYCPIAETHPIARYGGIDPLDHKIWLPADTPLMKGSKALVVCMMEGWETSFGIAEEKAAFAIMSKPVYYMEWPRHD